MKAWCLARCRGIEAQLLKEVLGKLLRTLRPRERLCTGHEVGLKEQVARVKQALVGSKVTCLMGKLLMECLRCRPFKV